MNKIFLLATMILLSACNQKPEPKTQGSWEALKTEAGMIGKPDWRPMLVYVANLHQISTHPQEWPFDYEWEEIGPGYAYSPAFGHWDIVHQVIDVMPAFPQHTLHQLMNNIKNQEPHGLIPGSIWMPDGKEGLRKDSAIWSKEMQGHPPMWVFAVDDYIELTGEDSVLNYFYNPLIRQISWFENKRNADREGFFYQDILTHHWESGVDEGIRFDDTDLGRWACIDATCHVYYLYRTAIKWSRMLGLDTELFELRAQELKTFIQEDLYLEEDGLFYDIWAMEDPRFRTLAFETLFPLVVGAASQDQANRLIDEYLLDTTCFNTVHPVATVGLRDPKFELRLWRGSSWNSMTYWIARGCLSYGRDDAARIILEKALDNSAYWFEQTGTIWEFYHPLGGDPKEVQRKPQTSQNTPCRDYLGHNPLMAMARMYDQIILKHPLYE